MKNLQNWRWALKGWVKRKKLLNGEGKEKLLNDINVIDFKEEKMNLMES